MMQNNMYPEAREATSGVILSPPKPSGSLAQLVIRVQQCNNRITETIMHQAEHACRLVGHNPIGPATSPDEQPRAEGELNDLEFEIARLEEHLSALQQVTETWAGL